MRLFPREEKGLELKIFHKPHRNPGEGNGNPLQCSCPENPVDGGAWRAAVHGVTQSQAQLKRLRTHACIGEGNSSPLQCSCLENPRGARWAAVYGAAQSRARLKRLSSSSISTHPPNNPRGVGVIMTALHTGNSDMLSLLFKTTITANLPGQGWELNSTMRHGCEE